MSDVVGGAAVVIVPDVSGFADALAAAIGPAMDAAQVQVDGFATNVSVEFVAVGSTVADGVTAAFEALTAGLGTADTYLAELDAKVGDFSNDALTAADALSSVGDAAATGFDFWATAIDDLASRSADAVGSVDEVAASLDQVGTSAAVNISETGATIGDLGDAAAAAAPKVIDLEKAQADATAKAEDMREGVANLTGDLGSLGAAGDIASGGLDSVGGITATLGEGLANTTEKATDLAEKFGADLGPEAEALAGSLAGVGAALGVIGGFTDVVVGKAAAATSATQRFNLILGDQADKVNKVNIAGLNEDLGTMVNELGSGASAVREADASLFQLGQSSGASQDQIAKTAEQLNVLSTRAVALKPSLGDVGTVADSIQNSLARGGKFAGNFGLSLTSLEINTRAMNDTGKTAVNQLTQFDKITAGAAISVEKLGDHLKTDITAGADNVTFDFKRIQLEFNKALVDLGKPLISPTLDLLKAALPIGIQFAGLLGDAAKVALPLVTSLVKGIGPLVTIVADDLGRAFKTVEPAIEKVGKSISETLADPDVVAAVENVAKGGADLVVALAPLIPLVVELTPTVPALTIGLNTLAASAELAAQPFIALENVLEALGLVTPQNAQATDIQTKATAAQAKAAADAAAAQKDVTKAEQDNITVVTELNAAMTIGADGFAFLGLNIEQLRGKTDKELKATAETLGVNADAFKTWSKDVLQFVDQVVSGAQSQLPKIADAFTFNGGKQLFDPATIELQLKKQSQSVQDFQKNLEILSGRGLDNIVNQLLTQGPVVGGALAASLIAGAPDRAAALNDQLAVTQTAFDALTNWVRDVFAPKFAAETGFAAKDAGVQFGINLNASLPQIEAAGASISEAFLSGVMGGNIGASLTSFAAGLVADLDKGFAQGVDQLTGASGGAIGAARNMANSITNTVHAALGIHSPSTVFAQIGQNTVLGFVQGINDGVPDVSAAMSGLIDGALPASGSNVFPIGSAGMGAAVAAGSGSGDTVIQIGPIHVDGTGMTTEDAKSLGQTIVASAAEEAARRQMEIKAAIYAA